MDTQITFWGLVWDSIESSQFLSSFWGDLIAGLILLALASWLVPKYLRWRNRPRLLMINASTRKPRWKFTLAQNGQWSSYAKLVIRNRGNKTIERFYWEMYVKPGASVKFEQSITGNTKYSPFYVENKDNYRRFYGFIEAPIFPLESIDFNYAIYITSEERVPVNIYYYFKTDQGQYPFWAWAAVWLKKFSFLKKLTVF